MLYNFHETEKNSFQISQLVSSLGPQLGPPPFLGGMLSPPPTIMARPSFLPQDVPMYYGHDPADTGW